MVSQLSTAQDKIGAAERRTKLLEQKNENLQKELDSWNEDTPPEFTSNLQFVASGSGLPHFGMPISHPSVATSTPVSMPMIGGPQASPILLSDPTGDITPFGGPQGNRRVSLVPCLMRRQDQVEMAIMMAMVELLGPELYRHNHRVHLHSIWELSPKNLRCSMDEPMKMCQRGWRSFQISFIYQKPLHASR